MKYSVMKTLLFFTFLCSISLKSQVLEDSLKSDNVMLKDKGLKFKEIILPSSLIVFGTLLSGSSFEKKIAYSINKGSVGRFNIPMDDYIQYIPLAEIYTANFIGVKSENHWFDQTKYLLIANIITSMITHLGKNIINKQRPNGSNHAFPSGHTSFSFVNSSVLYEEYKDTSSLLAYSGFGISTLVGGLRIMNNKHWFSDVIVGAGVGILVAKLVYYFKPFKKWNPFKKIANINFIPSINDKQFGIYFNMQF